MLSMDAPIYVFEVVGWLRRGEGSIIGFTKGKRKGGRKGREGNERPLPVPPSDPPNSLSLRDTQITAGLVFMGWSLPVSVELLLRKEWG
jgi:hypothetical protein